MAETSVKMEWKTTTDLPEEGKENIVLASINCNVEVGYFLTLDEFEDADGEILDKETAFFSVDEISSWSLDEVDAWMPLPAPLGLCDNKEETKC